MPIQVKLPNGQIGSFPDDMPHEQIEAVLQKQFGFAQEPSPQEDSQSFMNRLPRNIATGAVKGLVDIGNLPYQLASAFEKPMGARKFSLPEGFAEKLHIQEPDYSKLFGLKGELSPSDKAIQLGSELISPFAEEKLAQLGIKGLSKLPGYAEKLANLPSKLPLTQAAASKPYGQIEAAVEEAGLKNFPVNPENLSEAKKILVARHPFKHEAEKIISEAKKGDYKDVFRLQETLKDIGRDMKSSGKKLERRSAKSPDSLAAKILSGIQGHMAKGGLNEEAELLGDITGNYRRYKKLEANVYNPVKKYAKKGVGLGIGALLGAAGYKGSKSLLDNDYYGG